MYIHPINYVYIHVQCHVECRVYICYIKRLGTHVLMRDEKEGRKKQAIKVKQTNKAE